MSIHLMVVVVLVALVLYQKSEGGALGIGQSGLFSGRGQANALTRATSILGAIFFLTSVLLTVLPAWERRNSAGGEDWTKAFDQSIELKEVKPPPATAPDAEKPKSQANESESIFDQLKRAQEQRRAASGKTDAPAPEATSPAPEAPASGSAPSAAPDQPPVEAPKN